MDTPDRHDPAETLRELYRSFELRDLGRLGRLLADEVVCRGLGDSGEQVAGRQELLADLAAAVAASAGTVTWRPIAIMGWSGRRAIGVHEERSWRDGSLRSGWAGLFVEAEGGRIQRVDRLAARPHLR